MSKFIRTVRLASVLLLAGWLNTGLADAEGCLTHEEARAALQSGEVMSLAQIRGQLATSVGGKIIHAELCRDGSGGYFYEVYVQVGGSVKRFRVDAATGDISGKLILPAEGSYARFDR